MSRAYTPGHVAAIADFMLGLSGIDAEVTHRLDDLDFDAVGEGFEVRLRWNSPVVSIVMVETSEAVRIHGLVGEAFANSERLIAALVSESPENGQKEASSGTKERWGRGSSPTVGWSPPAGDPLPANLLREARILVADARGTTDPRVGPWLQAVNAYLSAS